MKGWQKAEAVFDTAVDPPLEKRVPFPGVDGKVAQAHGLHPKTPARGPRHD
jgi:hypothetical protein